MRPNTTESKRSVNAKFVGGFVSALLLLFIGGVLMRAYEYFEGRQFVAAIVELLTTPMFSVLDLVTGVMMLAAAWVVLYMAAFGPRL